VNRGEERQRLDLAQATQMLLDECRMILPGVQAIFGFQLIAAFNERFSAELTRGEQALHLVALCLVAVAAALIMAPAAYHRTRGARETTDTFVRLSTRLLLASMVPLGIGLSLDVLLIARLTLGAPPAAAFVAGALLAVMAFFWFVFPHLPDLRR
jgi:uncharacterized protein DUF6328